MMEQQQRQQQYHHFLGNQNQPLQPATQQNHFQVVANVQSEIQYDNHAWKNMQIEQHHTLIGSGKSGRDMAQVTSGHRASQQPQQYHASGLVSSGQPFELASEANQGGISSNQQKYNNQLAQQHLRHLSMIDGQSDSNHAMDGAVMQQPPHNKQKSLIIPQSSQMQYQQLTSSDGQGNQMTRQLNKSHSSTRSAMLRNNNDSNSQQSQFLRQGGALYHKNSRPSLTNNLQQQIQIEDDHSLPQQLFNTVITPRQHHESSGKRQMPFMPKSVPAPAHHKHHQQIMTSAAVDRQSSGFRHNQAQHHQHQQAREKAMDYKSTSGAEFNTLPQPAEQSLNQQNILNLELQQQMKSHPTSHHHKNLQHQQHQQVSSQHQQQLLSQSHHNYHRQQPPLPPQYQPNQYVTFTNTIASSNHNQQHDDQQYTTIQTSHRQKKHPSIHHHNQNNQNQHGITKKRKRREGGGKKDRSKVNSRNQQQTLNQVSSGAPLSVRDSSYQHRMDEPQQDHPTHIVALDHENNRRIQRRQSHQQATSSNHNFMINSDRRRNDSNEQQQVNNIHQLNHVMRELEPQRLADAPQTSISNTIENTSPEKAQFQRRVMQDQNNYHDKQPQQLGSSRFYLEKQQQEQDLIRSQSNSQRRSHDDRHHSPPSIVNQIHGYSPLNSQSKSSLNKDDLKSPSSNNFQGSRYEDNEQSFSIQRFSDYKETVKMQQRQQQMQGLKTNNFITNDHENSNTASQIEINRHESVPQFSSKANLGNAVAINGHEDTCGLMLMPSSRKILQLNEGQKSNSSLLHQNNTSKSRQLPLPASNTNLRSERPQSLGTNMAKNTGDIPQQRNATTPHQQKSCNTNLLSSSQTPRSFQPSHLQQQQMAASSSFYSLQPHSQTSYPVIAEKDKKLRFQKHEQCLESQYGRGRQQSNSQHSLTRNATHQSRNSQLNMVVDNTSQNNVALVNMANMNQKQSTSQTTTQRQSVADSIVSNQHNQNSIGISAFSAGVEDTDLPSLAPLYKIATEVEPSPLKEHTKVISQFLETYKIRDLQNQKRQSSKSHHHHQRQNSTYNQNELFERLERELTSIVQVFQRERQLMKRENQQLRKMLEERDLLIGQIQSDFKADKDRMLQSFQLEKTLQSQSIDILKEDMQKLAKDFERISDKLTSREAEIEKLRVERSSLAAQLTQYEQQKDEWQLQTQKQQEEHFNEQLESIRQGFDKQLRDLIENHKLETEVLEQALREKQSYANSQKQSETKEKFSKDIPDEIHHLKSISDEKQNQSVDNIMNQQQEKQQNDMDFSLGKDQSLNYQSVADVINLKYENAQAYQDTIERLRLRVNQLQERLLLDESKEVNSQNESIEHVVSFKNTGDNALLDGVTGVDSQSVLQVQNRIENMRLNFELLEQKLAKQKQLQQQDQEQYLDSGRIFVVNNNTSGNFANQNRPSMPQIDATGSNNIIMSQGSLTGRFSNVQGQQPQNNNINNTNRNSLFGADRSAGQDSLETVADFRGRTLADGTQNSTSAFIQVMTPRLNSGQQSARLNQTQNGNNVSREAETTSQNQNLIHDTEVQNNSSLIGVSLRSEASTMNILPQSSDNSNNNQQH